MNFAHLDEGITESAIYRNTLQRTATHCNMHCMQIWACSSSLSTSIQTATHCNTLQHTATRMQHTATHCNTLQRTATHCNTLQHTVTHCNMQCMRIRARSSFSTWILSAPIVPVAPAAAPLGILMCVLQCVAVRV